MKILFFICMILFCVPFVHSAALELTKEEQVWLDEHPDIVLAGGLGYSPILMLDENNNMEGIAVDYINLVNSKLNSNISITPFKPRSNIKKDFTEEGIDGIALGSWRFNDNTNLLRSQTLLSTYLYGFILERNIENINSLDDIKDKTVGYLAVFGRNDFVTDKTNSKSKIEYATYETMYSGLLTGDVDIIVGGIGLQYWKRKKLIDDLKNVMIVDAEEIKLSTFIRSDWPIFNEILKKVIKSINAKEMDLILARWIGSEKDNKDIGLTLKEQKWLDEHPNITLGAGLDYPPILMKDNLGRLEGISIDYINLINDKLNTNILISSIDSTGKLTDEFNKNKIDGIALGSWQFKDNLNFTGTKSVYSAFLYAFTLDRNKNVIEDIHNLKNKRIGFLSIIKSSDFIKNKIPSNNKKVYENYEDMYLGLIKGEVDIIIGALGLQYWKKKTRNDDLVNVLIVNSSEIEIATYIRSDWNILSTILNKAIASIKTEEFDVVMNRWVGYDQYKKIISLTNEERLWLSDNKIINYTYDNDWDPLEFKDKNGSHNGLSSEYLNEISKILNITFEPVEGVSWKEAKDLFINNKIELFPLMPYKENNDSEYLYSKPLITLKPAIYSSNDKIFVSGIDGLTEERVAVVNGYAIHNWMIKHHPDIELVLVDNLKEGFELLSDNKVYAFIENSVVGSKYVSKHNLLNVRVIGEVPFDYQLSIAVRPDLVHLHSVIQKAIDIIPESRKSEIESHWLSIKYEHLIDYTVLKVFILFVLFLILVVSFLMYKAKRLKIEVDARKKSEVELSISKQKYIDLFHHAAEGIVIADKDGNIESFNKMAEHIFGYIDSEIIGRNIEDLLPDNIKKTHGDYIKNYKSHSKKTIFNVGREVKGKNNNGEILDLHISISQNEFSGNKKFMILVQDISVKKESDRLLQESYDNLELFSNASFESIVMHCNDKIMHANNQFFNMLGYDKEVVLNELTMKDSLSEESFQRAIEHIKSKSTTPLNLEFIHKNGSIIYTETQATKLYYKNQYVRVVAIKDVTEYKKRQIDLKLEKTEAENASKAKSKFISSMSHELRSPLNAVIGFSQLLKLDGLSQQEVQENATEILHAGNHLLELINEILDLSSVESGNLKYNYEKISVFDVLMSIKTLMNCLADKFNITLDINDVGTNALLINVDKVKFKQIIINIVSNAIKYNKKGGRVSVSCNINSVNWLEVIVEDTGMGIAEDDIALIFEPFNRLNIQNHTIQGTGIGLTITKELINTMGGEISVSSKKDEGSTFTVAFPLVRAS